jgi:hypothetical protein
MGFSSSVWGGDFSQTVLKRKFRWLFNIENITTGNSGLPCLKASRPKIQFREMQAEHLNETISYPSKPEWQPIQIVLYDRCTGSENPIFTWLKQQYDPSSCSKWKPCVAALSFKTCATLNMLDGCGNILETWLIEHCYPQSIDFGELDMSDSGVVTVDFTLKYDRAYQTYPSGGGGIYSSTSCSSCQDTECVADSGGGGSGSGMLAFAPRRTNRNPEFSMIF